MKKAIIMLLALSAVYSCKENQKEEQAVKEEEQTIAPVTNDVLESSVIYEANIRQYSPEGTFDAFTKDIPQLKELGVKVIWLMPIHPISMKNRKATGELSVEDIQDEEERKKYLGSYYAISDYTDVNPEFGNFKDFEELVETAHQNGMYVILDWVANHTGWDHKWITQNPEYYTQNEKGEVIDPLNPDTGESWGWTDVADLNYENKDLWKAMSEDMKFWVEKYNIDGFRADVAGEVPTEFWEQVASEIREDKQIFMLAESEDKDLFKNAFDMGYNWEGHHIMNEMAQGKKSALDWDAYMQKIDSTYDQDDYLMNFVTNHDENSWNGTIKERLGEASETMMALTYTIPGMPLIYSGQEYDMEKRLRFFEKDTIPKTKGEVWPLLVKLGKLKNENKALHGAKNAASYQEIGTSNEKEILAFKREKEDAELVYIANISDKATNFGIQLEGTFENYMTGETLVISEDKNMDLEPWQYLILINK
ncbi:alpha amylase catalytic subunit [Salegentibacter sp. 24]|uniref:alpha-amylase family glycosyl hydrolase n=1 Tax=Salegentibacter sp. 24 TaxID=2183986 RepID=UPI00105F4476|nr:alpha-amylase family glycosyl hydrolase [Salegentibacter sp. 24]TDN87622.1 alpha amylase catalytic subunit [Salegentibacter sp. 24]